MTLELPGPTSFAHPRDVILQQPALTTDNAMTMAISRRRISLELAKDHPVAAKAGRAYDDVALERGRARQLDAARETLARPPRESADRLATTRRCPMPVSNQLRMGAPAMAA